MKKALVLFLSCGLCALTYADWVTGFEAPDYTGSAAGTVLTGQQAWYNPVAGSVDAKVYTYGGNALGLVQNPEGGDQFVGERSDGGTAYARAEHAFAWADRDVWKMSVDVAAAFNGTLPATDNVGSLSLQPSATSRYWQYIMTWQDVNTATAFKAGYLTNESPSSPVWPGAEWQNLPVNHWYRLSTTFRFSDNLILECTIKDLTTQQETTVQPIAWHLLQGTMPVPTGLRFFAGGTTAGNIMGWDGLSIIPEPATLALLALGLAVAARRAR